MIHYLHSLHHHSTTPTPIEPTSPPQLINSTPPPPPPIHYQYQLHHFKHLNQLTISPTTSPPIHNHDHQILEHLLHCGTMTTIHQPPPTVSLEVYFTYPDRPQLS
ncbi:hypothetical protein O181_084594 [Austropuccinia psidii MF-1]|uniref:Uncharacterized protein n=1 Tax=Austropuccinia psidii MF-1 TaxID=1389203 RepID=A0A9Q3FTQ6_9BASI|nr:hypothetical protein [Austropuccinia psidii MF-1]